MDTQPSEHETWRKARVALRDKEDELLRASDELAKARRALPLLNIEKTYHFSDSQGPQLSLRQLFRGRKQLIIYHAMFDPQWDAPCKFCSFVIDQLPSHIGLLRERNTELAIISRAPPTKLSKWKAKMDWSLNWYSSFGSDFNYDFFATIDRDDSRGLNIQNKANLDVRTAQERESGEQPGLSVFVQGDEGEVYYSYSIFERDIDPFLTSFNLLAMTPLGRQDNLPEASIRYHFEYIHQ